MKAIDSGRRRRTIAVVALATALTNATTLGVFVASPSIRLVLELRADAFGLLLSIGLGFGIAGSVASGWLADRGHLRPSFCAAFVLMVVSYAVCTFPPFYPLYLAALSCAGLANSGALTLASVTAARAFPEGSRKALTTIMLAHSIAGVITPPLWEMLVDAFTVRFAAAAGLQLFFLVMAGTCLLAGTVFLLAPFPAGLSTRKPVEPAGRTTGPPLWGLPLIIVCLFAALQAGAFNSVVSWIPEFAKRAFAPNPFPVSWILSGISLAYVAGRLALLRLPEGLPDLKILTACAGTGAALLAAAFLSPNQYMMGILCVAGGLILSADWPAIFSHTSTLFSASSARAIALAGASGGVMSFLLPPAMGVVAEQTDSLTAGMMLPVGLFAALSVLAFLWRLRLARAAGMVPPSAS